MAEPEGRQIRPVMAAPDNPAKVLAQAAQVEVTRAMDWAQVVRAAAGS